MTAWLVGEGDRVPPATIVALSDALASVRALQEPDQKYVVGFVDDDEQILRRFTRDLALEGWLMARPVDDNGKFLRGDRVVCPMMFDSQAAISDREAFEATLKADLQALLDGGA